MKILKLNHEVAQLVLAGKKTSTWRLFDDKDLSVNDKVEFIDKVDPSNPDTWTTIGLATITELRSKRLEAISKEDVQGYEQYRDPEIMYAELRKFYGSHVDSQTPVKVIYFDFKPYVQHRKMADFAVEATTIHNEIKMYADGGSRGNPGPSASGYVLLDMNDTVLQKSGLFLGITTNNQAEYLALKLGLEAAIKLQARIVHVYMDSLLVINQMKGIFRVKNKDLRPIHENITDLAKDFDKIYYRHVPRELNKLADAEVNETLDAAEKKTNLY